MSEDPPPPADKLLAMGRTLEAVGGDAALQPLFREEAVAVLLRTGEVLAKQGEVADHLFLLIEGSLDVLREPEGIGKAPQRVTTLRAPNIVGEMQVLTGGVRLATLRAAEPCVLARLPAEAFQREANRNAQVMQAIAALAYERLRRTRLLAMLPALLETSDPALVEHVAQQAEWAFARRGEAVVRDGEPGGDVFMVVDGRLRAVLESADGRVLGDLVPGDIFGETQLFTGGRRNATVFALRDSVLARFSRERLESVMRQVPDLGMRLACVAVERAQQAIRPVQVRRTAMNVMLVGADNELTLDCARRLRQALLVHGSAAHVSRAAIGRALGRPELCDVPDGDARATQLNAWLTEREAQHAFLLFVADDSPAWAARCLAHADIVMHVTTPGGAAHAHVTTFASPPSDPPLEAKQWLVVQHAQEHRPQRTSDWGRHIPISRFFHVRRESVPDFGRLARAVAGREIGIVLGGGGARGYAHLGLLAAIEELSIPVDVIGGTSAGAAIAGYYAAGLRGKALEDTVKAVLGGSVDYTLPLVALSAGRRMLKRTREVFGTLHFEDLPLPTYCVATDITRFGMMKIDRGAAAEGVMASSCLPGIFPPVNIDGRWTVDGALVNAVPMDVMRDIIGPQGILIASDVNAGAMAESAAAPEKSGVGALQQLLRMLLRRPAHPSIADVLQRAATAAGDHQVKRGLAASRPDICIRHDTAGHSVIDFKQPAPLRDKGYAKSMEALKPLLVSPRMPPLA